MKFVPKLYLMPLKGCEILSTPTRNSSFCQNPKYAEARDDTWTMDPMVLSSFFCRHVGHDLQIWGNSSTFFCGNRKRDLCSRATFIFFCPFII